MAEKKIQDGDVAKWIQNDIDTEVKIRLMSKAALREISKKAANRARLTHEDVADVSDKLLGRAAVLGWRKMDDHNHPGFIVNGKPLEFTPENIDLLMTKSIKFSRFVNEMCVDEDEFVEGIEEIKND